MLSKLIETLYKPRYIVGGVLLFFAVFGLVPILARLTSSDLPVNLLSTFHLLYTSKSRRVKDSLKFNANG